MIASRSSLAVLILLLALASVLTFVEAHNIRSVRRSAAATQSSPSSSSSSATSSGRPFTFGYSWQEQHRIRREQRLKREGRYDESRWYDYSTPQTLTQLLDHFDANNNATWTQTYYVNQQFVNSTNKPQIVFLVISGESAADVEALAEDNPAFQAQHFGALAVMLEHRFYGSSYPNINVTETANMRFLTSEQALADLVTFRAHIMQQCNLTEDAQWIVSGGSYAGALSAWARLKYPHLFIGSIASSAPIEAELDYYQYNEVVEQSLGPECSSQISAAFATITAMLNTTAGQAKLSTDFGCGPFSALNDQRVFMNGLAQSIQSTVQYAGDDGGAYSIASVCDYFPANSTTTPYQNFVSYSNGQGSGCSFTSYDNFVSYIQSSGDYRSWVWQTCNEFGYMITDDTPDEPFGHLVTVGFDEQLCQDLFGISNVKANVQKTDAYYGGANIVTTNTFFTQGSLDPWHALGNKQMYANGTSSQNANVMVTGTGHCADWEGPSPTDLPQLIAVREQQINMIALWLSQDLAEKEAAKTFSSASIAME